MHPTPIDRLIESLAGAVARDGDRLSVPQPSALSARMDGLVREAVFGDAETKPAARWIIGEAAQALGIRPASIHDLYRAEGRAGDRPRFTVPAMNLRMLPYDAARAIFRAARKIDAGAFIFEIARQRDRIHRPASRRIRRDRPGRGHPRGIPGTGFSPGRPFPDLGQEIRLGSRFRNQGHTRFDRRIDRRRVLTTSTSTPRRWSTSAGRTWPNSNVSITSAAPNSPPSSGSVNPRA